MNGKLTHFDDQGAARMVDVSGKQDTLREAVAGACVHMLPETLALITEGGVAKGDVFGVARVAGIMAAKRTPELIPLCHSLNLTSVEIAFEPDTAASCVHISATRAHHREDRGRDGGAYRGRRRRPDDLRHVQGRGPRHDHQRCAPAEEDRR